MTRTALEALEVVRKAAKEAAEEGQLPSFLAGLEQVRVEALLGVAPRLEEPIAEEKPRVLTPTQAGTVVGRSKWWIYDHRHELGSSLVALPGGRFGFDEGKLRRWIQRRSAS